MGGGDHQPSKHSLKTVSLNDDKKVIGAVGCMGSARRRLRRAATPRAPQSAVGRRSETTFSSPPKKTPKSRPLEETNLKREKIQRELTSEMH
ncbi:hypothetical protein EVAR_24867_1 [Eumeta japonica]|uniref:Uncharacterized protein n=1 Tax=Eumeta variegata TaxID=151549 RepID=A0A4C1YCA9_EUMVA|nr:hypothetical protein EVAR_24867_1 [Eumeta japonica]